MKKVYDDIKHIFESQVALRVMLSILVLIIALLIFTAGVTVGVHKASFGQAWGEHYLQNFGMMREQKNFGVGGGNFPNAHGATGKIIKIELPNIIVEDRDNTEKTILISDETRIEEGRDSIVVADLKVNDFVVTLGAPDDKGVIEAKFIRVIPSPELLK